MTKILIAMAILALVGGLVALNLDKTEEVVIEEEISNEESEAPESSQVETQSSQIDSGLVLDLSEQGLLKVPDYVFDRVSIQELNLSGNSLQGSLQAEVRHLQNIKILDLSDNKFTGVPAEVGQLSRLEVLDLSNNQITGLPYELGNLSNLQTLDLRGNNYAQQDLDIIKGNLSDTVTVLTD